MLRRPYGRSALLTFAVAVLPIALCIGCGSGRSAEAYCKTYEDGFNKIKQQYPDVDQYTSSDDNPMVMLARILSATGDIIALIGDMAKVAPDEIQSDTQRVHDSLESTLAESADTAGNAVGRNLAGALSGLASGLMASMTSAGALERMDKFIVANCDGKHMFSVSPQE